MGFLWRQGGIRMDLVLGLLILIGTMLEGSEGITCYTEKKKKQRTCGEETNGCVKYVQGDETVKGCGKEVFDEVDQIVWRCYEQVFGRCANLDDVHDLENDPQIIGKMNRCFLKLSGKSGRTSSKHDGDFSRQLSRQAGEPLTTCVCFTDLCNPAGRSAPNGQVIFGVLVAASILAFNVGLGSL